MSSSGTKAKPKLKKTSTKFETVTPKSSTRTAEKPTIKTRDAKSRTATARGRIGWHQKDIEPGYNPEKSGVLMPIDPKNKTSNKDQKPVDPSGMTKGLIQSKEKIRSFINEMMHVMTQDFEIAEIELSMSFDVKGSFMGFGMGGATSVKVKIKPVHS